jgi:hypothetical protein
MVDVATSVSPAENRDIYQRNLENSLSIVLLSGVSS